MTTDNMKFWDSVKKTDPKRVKAITGKQYKGNSPQPYYLVERMTEQFGMCGIGWGLNIINERMERLTETDVLHVAVVEIWYVYGDKKGSISQIGQTKACYKKADGGMMIDEDAPKKSVTDAMTKCMSYLGFAGDIFSGQWDDSKYVQGLNNEFNGKLSPKPSPLDAPVYDLPTPERMEQLKEIAAEIVDFHTKGMFQDAFVIFDNISDSSERNELWKILQPNSAVRSKLTAINNEMKASKK
jgi:hypothetical protein